MFALSVNRILNICDLYAPVLFISNIPFSIFVSLCNVSWYYFSSILTHLQMFTVTLRRQGRNPDFSETDRQTCHYTNTVTNPSSQNLLFKCIYVLSLFIVISCSVCYVS